MKSLRIKRQGQRQYSAHTIEKAFAEVILGRPSAKCKHFGICEIKKIYTQNFFKYTSGYYKCPKTVYAFASLQIGVSFELAFLRRFIDDAIFKSHFESGIFNVDEDYISGCDFMNNTVHIRKGQYKVDFSDTLLTVRFDLRNEGTI